MPHRNRDNSGKILSNAPTASYSQPSLFFSGCDQEEPLGEQQDTFEEPIGEEEEENISLSQWLKIEMLGAIPLLPIHPLKVKLETC